MRVFRRARTSAGAADRWPGRSAQLGKLVSHNFGGGQPSGYAAFRWTGWFWPERDGRHELSIRGPGRDARVAGRRAADRRVDAGRARPARPRRRRLRRARPPPWSWPPAAAIRSRSSTSARCRPATSRRRRRRGGRALLGVRQPRRAPPRGHDRRGRRAGRELRRRRRGDRRGLDQRGRGLRPHRRSTCPATRTRWWRRCWRPIRAPSSCWSNGAPYALPWIDHAPAVLEGWLGGEAGPDAVARILLGEAEPSGRLPVTFPAAARGHAGARLLSGRRDA